MAGEKKRRPGKADYNDFQRDLNGNYLYNGPTVRYNAQNMPRRRALAVLWALGGGALALLVAAGFVPAPGAAGQLLIVLPYAVAVVAGISVCWALARLTAGGDPLRLYVWEGTVGKLPVRTLLTAGAAALSTVGELVYLSSNDAQGKGLAAAAYLLLLGAAAAMQFLLRNFAKNLCWNEES